ncbi:MAG: replication-relaxation family protein [Oscillochloridaceae bacterium umkhey_bin13]
MAIPPRSDRDATRRTGLPRMHLQPRDVAMLASLSEARYLTACALEWLHFATWRTRYRAFAEQQASTRYQASSNLYHRLAGLQAAGLVSRLGRSAESGTLSFRRQADAYALTAAGAEVLADQLGGEREGLWYETQRPKAIQNFAHRVAIGVCYAALRAELEYRQVGLSDWQGDHLLARGAYDRVPVPGRHDPIPVLPDATCLLAGERCFLEIDRGTRPLRSWQEKTRAYESYRGHALLASRYATHDFRVLIVAPTAQRVQRIAEEIAKVTQAASPQYLLITEDRVHPTTIRRGWQGLTALAWTPRQVIDRVVLVPDVRLGGRVLWGEPS